MKKKILSCAVPVIAFVVGAVCGALIYANRGMFDFGASALCIDGANPDKNGCCSGEIYNDMGDLGFNCCPEIGGDCFPPLR